MHNERTFLQEQRGHLIWAGSSGALKALERARDFVKADGSIKDGAWLERSCRRDVVVNMHVKGGMGMRRAGLISGIPLRDGAARHDSRIEFSHITQRVPDVGWERGVRGDSD